MQTNHLGFTLIELLVVVLIIGILASVALPQYEKAVEKSRAAEAITMLNYMHKQAQLCALANGEDCNSKTNEELGIELGNGFTCHKNSDSEVCCNKYWCYINNSLDWGDRCASGSGLTPIAARVNGIPANFNNVDRKYLLEMEDCETGSKRIACYESEKWCKMFGGEGVPIN